MGGEPLLADPQAIRALGLSPRGRGTLSWIALRSTRCGSIPAWAGNPCPRRRRRWGPAVYPRVGGEPAQSASAGVILCGLSPRGRGTLGAVILEKGRGGSIPAWAGNPLGCCPAKLARRVYPRVGGEPLAGVSSSSSPKGLSPRGRGTLGRGVVVVVAQGSIPAWAGNPTVVTPTSRAWAGSIPAWAGNPPRTPTSERGRGLSPRGRGTRVTLVAIPGARSIPAWAGNPAVCSTWPSTCRVYPRVGGEPTHDAPMMQVRQGLSPRGRGTLSAPFE